MSSILLSLPDLYKSYKKWVSKNPVKANDYEVTFKWISYLAAGHINNSHVLSELVYCLSNLLVLFNDNIIRKQKNLIVEGSSSRLKVYLTVLEYAEVFLELSSQKLWGNRGKWFVIVCIQVLKCAARMLLVYKYKETVTQSPPIPVLLRGNLNENFDESNSNDSNMTMHQQHLESVSFNLKRSGKVIRKVDASPPLHIRNWKPIQKMDYMENNEAVLDQTFAKQQIVAESIYLIKPLAHLGAMGCFGQLSWKPYLLSLVMDLASLRLFDKSGERRLGVKDKQELVRRYVNLLCYLVRSPFYDQYSRQKISNLLLSLSRNIPFIGLVCNPLNNYIPFWQGNYSHVWN